MAGSDGCIAFRTLGGEGPDCLLIHGFGSDRLSWLGTTPALLPVVKVHVLDLPGHGESGTYVGDGSLHGLARQVEAELAARALTRVHIIGHSLGGGIGLLLAAELPGLVASLALLAPAGLGASIDAAFLRDYPGLTDTEAALPLLRKLVVRPQLISKHLAGRVIEQLSRPGAREALQKIANHLMEDDGSLGQAATTVAAAKLPRMSLWGAQDTITPLSAERLDAFGGERHILDAVGHLPHIESVKAVNAHLIQFISAAQSR